ncbi:MAG: translational GTPase TypA [Pirellulaceae bacterium]|nr:translational GTPase TypA [Pirellulaceae bacterium]
MNHQEIRNIVIIAHVDHGKTTLVDCILRQCGQFRANQLVGDQILDSNDLERERGITILAKNIAVQYKGIKINVIDTPGHADFGGEVERVLRMADGALVLVDAAEGPMPQTRFVLSKAIEVGLRPIVVINKIDRPDARTLEVVDEAFELILELGGESYLDDLSHIFASAKQGFATRELDQPSTSIFPLMDMILEKVPPPKIASHPGPSLMVTTLDWSDYVGRIAIGRVLSGSFTRGQTVSIMQSDDQQTNAKLQNIFEFNDLGRAEVEQAQAGDVVALVGLEDVKIGDTICSPDYPLRLPRIEVDHPTLEMVFMVNSSPFAGREGKYVTSRQIRERLQRELQKNVALRVTQGESGLDAFRVAGRGILHLAVLIETMRREGYELAVGKPQVLFRMVDGERCEPFETLVVEVPTDRFGPVMEMVGARRGDLRELKVRGEFSLASFVIPSRGLIGLRTRLLNATQGTAIINHRFLEYRPVEGDPPRRANGVLVSMVQGRVNAYALDTLQERSELFVGPGDEVYEGMLVGENARDNDLPVNPTREKKLTNFRASGSDDNILLKPPRVLTLEAALEYIEDDELVEVTPTNIRLRKALLKESDRRRLQRVAIGT